MLKKSIMNKNRFSKIKLKCNYVLHFFISNNKGVIKKMNNEYKFNYIYDEKGFDLKILLMETILSYLKELKK